ncbi:CLUMA_CG010494, isoform A [Clunio marinus]|uniref:CLUMA_CG010494, isoform A n=1 Tax=Clunio marinus TaxID=568069 RepID=A0A1J1I9U4_9DIPT|nr:CLUMA_CG010494, isoform A [Clunio marinus]
MEKTREIYLFVLAKIYWRCYVADHDEQFLRNIFEKKLYELSFKLKTKISRVALRRNKISSSINATIRIAIELEVFLLTHCHCCQILMLCCLFSHTKLSTSEKVKYLCYFSAGNE